MCKLKMNTVQMIELNDWDKLVESVYNRPYSFQQQDGCKSRGIYKFSIPNKWGIEDYENDTIPEVVNGEEMGVSFKAWLERDRKQPLPDRDDKFGLTLFWERNFYPSIDAVIDDLYQKGYLEEGDYIINIDW